MTNNYLLKDLDEFKIRYVKNRIKDKLYAIDNNDLLIYCYNKKNNYNHKFMVTNNNFFTSNRENVLMCRKLKEENIFEVITIPTSIDRKLALNMKKNVNRYFVMFNELLSYLSLNEDCISFKNEEYLSWYYGIDKNELENIKKIYFYDKSIVPYEDVSIKEAKLEYEVIPYNISDDIESVELEQVNNRISSQNIINEISKRQIKSKIAAQKIYTK